MDKQKIVKYLINAITLIITFIAVVILPDKVESLTFIGIAIIIVAAFTMIRYRKNTNICLLVGMMMIISICFALSVCLNTYDTAFNWQVKLIETESNIINAKNFLLFIAIFSIALGEISKKRDIDKIAENFNPLIAIGGFAALIYALIFGFDRGTIGTYSSNTNVLYEYAIVLYVIVWTYCQKNKKMKILLLIYAGLYCLQGLVFGDRSSCFPMILMVFLLIWKKNYRMIHIIIAGLGGIFLANAIDIFRNTGTLFSLETLKEVWDRGLFVNTISYSFYGGTQVIRYGMQATNQLQHFLQYALSLITGGSSQYSLTVIARDAGFLNKGGGMSHTYFYFWGGYLGTIIGAIVMARIINYIFNKETKLGYILRVTITIFLIRWFIYYPVAFFRTAIIVPAVAYLVFRIGNIICNKILRKIFRRKEMYQKKKIYIHGSFMNDNYGDFLLYYVVHNICNSFGKKCEVFSADIDESYDKYCKINRKSKLDGIFDSDLVVFAGGGYFGEPDKRKLYWNIRCLFKHLIPAFIISRRKVPYVIIGVETGPMSLKINKFLLRKICERAKILSVRNDESKEFLTKIGVKRQIEVNPDWIMGINKEMLLESPERAKEILKDVDPKMKKIFVHLTTRSSQGTQYVIEDLEKYMNSKENVYYVIGCDQKRQTQEERATDLANKFPEERRKVAFYEGPWTLSSLLNEADAVITDKLHVGIVATKFGKEVISVASHNKSVKFYGLIGRPEWTNHLNNIKPEETLEKLNKLSFENIKIDDTIFKKAHRNENLLRKFLKENIN